MRADGGPSSAPIAERNDAFGLGKLVNVWTPLVECTRENGAMQMIPGSHRLGLLEHEMGGAYWEDEDENQAESKSDKPGKFFTSVNETAMEQLRPFAVDVECGPGDIVLFSNILVHRGGTNTSSKIRWSLDWRFQDASKPTYREEKGHIVWASNHAFSEESEVENEGVEAEVVNTDERWSELALT